MNKDAYYFPHFSNARHDRKLKRLRKELGIEGYGIYFMVLEVLREQEDFSYPMDDLDLLADEFGTSEAKLKAVVNSYELFEIADDKFFYSIKFIEYLKPYLERSKRARNAALKRWNGANGNAFALPEHSVSNASKVNESKVNESKVNTTPEQSSAGCDSSVESDNKSGKGTKFKYDEYHYQLSEYLLGKILEFDPTNKLANNPPNLEAWAHEFRIECERYNRTPKEIGRVVQWLFNYYQPKGDFDWRENVQSAKAVRKHYDKLKKKSGAGGDQSINNIVASLYE